MTEYQNVDYEEEDEEFELKQEMLLRQAKVLYPEVEHWVLDMAIKAHLNLEALGNDYMPNTEEGERLKKSYFNGLEYKTEFAD